MENIAHSLCGLRLAQLGWTDRIGPRARWIGVLAANLPDVDLLWNLVDRDAALWYHRGLTHSFLGWPLLALAGAAVSRRFAPGTYRDHLGLWAAGLLSHALFDWPTTWGTLLFYPATDHRFSLEWIFIVDPMYWLLLGWVGGRFGARAGLLSLAGWVLLCAMGKELAEAQAPEPVRSFPGPLAPWHWTGVHVDAERTRRYWLTPWSVAPAGEFVTPGGPGVERLRATHRGERYFWMAHAPAMMSTSVDDQGESFIFSDLAFTNAWVPSDSRFTVEFRLRNDGSVEKSSVEADSDR